MPLNSTTYLEAHGWEGKGVPLDGKNGRGLKKPLSVPQKRNVKGLGKERDRAVEWWDCLFEASAKSISIAVPTANSVNGKATNPTAATVNAVVESANAAIAADGPSSSSLSARVSLIGQAKREHARKMLMSGFVRGRHVETDEEKFQRQLKEDEEARRQLEASAEEKERTATIIGAKVDEAKGHKSDHAEEAMKAKKTGDREKRKEKEGKKSRSDSKGEAEKEEAKKQKKEAKNLLKESAKREKKEEKRRKKEMAATSTKADDHKDSNERSRSKKRKNEGKEDDDAENGSGKKSGKRKSKRAESEGDESKKKRRKRDEKVEERDKAEKKARKEKGHRMGEKKEESAVSAP